MNAPSRCPALERHVPALAHALALTCAAWSAGAQTAPATPAPVGTMVFAGDVVPHAVLLRSFAARPPAALLAPVAPVVRAADLAFVNVESPVVADRPESAPSQLRFNAHPGFVSAIQSAGFDAIQLANNHGYDLGISGLQSTLGALRNAGIRALGATAPGEDPLAPQVFPLAGATLCVFAASRILNFDMTLPTAAQARMALARHEVPAEEAALLAAVRAHRARCGAVLVSLHTGVEYQDRPEAVDRVFFRRVADAGADAVIGHHSHTPQPVDVYVTGGRVVPLFYSLGNLASNQGGRAEADVGPESAARNVSLEPRAREGLLAVLRFAPGDGGRLRLASFGYVPLWTVNTQGAGASGDRVRISAGLMPRPGTGSAFLTRRWTSLLQRVGAQHLVPEGAVPGGAEAYRLSLEALQAPP